MLTYTMDVLPESIWLRTTPGASAMGQPYVCTEAGQYLAQGHFSTARTHKESYLLFYTLRGVKNPKLPCAVIHYLDAMELVERGYNAHAVLLFTDSYGKTYAKMLLQLT